MTLLVRSVCHNECVSQIVSLCSRIEDLGIVSRDHLNRLTEIVAYQGPSPLPAIALYHAAKRQNGLTTCHPPPHPRAFEALGHQCLTRRFDHATAHGQVGASILGITHAPALVAKIGQFFFELLTLVALH